ncbi:SGNH/GDSL hydrolase family protein [Microbacterium binotii]|uniref:SGNH/GDSL hydrolase family protein n=1 Tax=Microbacterium binotii TaxID=462710 RepID=A0ABP6BMH5_9MICO
MLFIGDSYTHGTGASNKDNRWSTIVAQAKGWTEDNEALGGTGFVTTSGVNGCGRDYCATYGEVIDSLTDATPSIVVIAGGQNDFRAYSADPDTVSNAIRSTYEKARARFPDARMISVGPTIIGDVSATVQGFDSVVREAAASVGAEYVNMIDPDVLDRSMDAGDGGHVNDTGHRAIADRVLSTIG